MSEHYLGHSGSVFKVAFDPFKTLLLSCSEDSTVRLWVHLQCWSCPSGVPWPRVVGVGRSLVASWPLLRHRRPRPHRTPLGHRPPSTAQDIRWTFFFLTSMFFGFHYQTLDFTLITDENITDDTGANTGPQKEEKVSLAFVCDENSPIKLLHFTRGGENKSYFWIVKGIHYQFEKRGYEFLGVAFRGGNLVRQKSAVKQNNLHSSGHRAAWCITAAMRYHGPIKGIKDSWT
ncbi:unnamed protein product [Danaus chrysippus]|uniref:(African queen) hypothetical protein n=1 Tax=Danaus chrysippus TaxID=151541 RepID=A0A8J2QX39_9NEOP|nr:unnamed protein product [Danaus chrysippus]